MECPSCGHQNPTEGTKDNKCDECGYLLSNSQNISSSNHVVTGKSKETDLVVIATFNNSLEANLIQQVLEQQGIQSWLQDEATVNIVCYLNITVGGIKLTVRKEEAELAIALLDEYQASLNEDNPEDSDSSTAEFEEEPIPILTPTDKKLTAAFRAAVIGLVFLPLQLYSLWMLLSLFGEGTSLKPRQKSKLVITLGLDLAILIVIWVLISTVI